MPGALKYWSPNENSDLQTPTLSPPRHICVEYLPLNPSQDIGIGQHKRTMTTAASTGHYFWQQPVYQNASKMIQDSDAEVTDSLLSDSSSSSNDRLENDSTQDDSMTTRTRLFVHHDNDENETADFDLQKFGEFDQFSVAKAVIIGRRYPVSDATCIEVQRKERMESPDTAQDAPAVPSSEVAPGTANATPGPIRHCHYTDKPLPAPPHSAISHERSSGSPLLSSGSRAIDLPNGGILGSLPIQSRQPVRHPVTPGTAKRPVHLKQNRAHWSAKHTGQERQVIRTTSTADVSLFALGTSHMFLNNLRSTSGDEISGQVLHARFGELPTQNRNDLGDGGGDQCSDGLVFDVASRSGFRGATWYFIEMCMRKGTDALREFRSY